MQSGPSLTPPEIASLDFREGPDPSNPPGISTSASTAAPSLQVMGASLKLCGDMDGADDVKALKDATFAERRRLLVHCRLPMGRFLEKFPWMRSEDEVSFCNV